MNRRVDSMIRRCVPPLALVAVASLLASLPAFADEASRAEDEQAIRAVAKEYLSALARGDAQAVAACWTADGEFIDAEGNGLLRRAQWTLPNMIQYLQPCYLLFHPGIL